MSILIKGMEMPTSCIDCKVRTANGCCGNLPHNTRMPYCPLVPVPPHGRLGDLNALVKEVQDIAKELQLPPDSIGAERFRLFAELITTAPTIIPPSEEAEP